MSANSLGVRILYGTVPGRALLDVIQKTRAERLLVRFLHSGASRVIVPAFARLNGIPAEEWRGRGFASYRDFFIRKREHIAVDETPDRLISPCDGWLSVYPITPERVFSIKGSRYRVADLLQDETLAERFRGIPLDAVYASDLTRTQTTALAVTRTHKLALRLEPRGFAENFRIRREGNAGATPVGSGSHFFERALRGAPRKNLAE